jgi:hypothetical protein
MAATDSEFSPDSSKPLASLSLDLDNQWSYMKTHGDAGWKTYPSYFDILIPVVLDLLDELGLKITFFIVGQDAALDKNRDTIQSLTENGHEVGNHSYHHEYLSISEGSDDIGRSILEAEDCIRKVTGHKPIGFRGPGFTWNKTLIETLMANGYLYDASTLPMFLGPLARLYYFWTSKLTDEEKAERKDLYGRFKDGFRPVKPFLWLSASEGSLLEVPVTTMPFFKIPIHLSYLLYISRISESLMRLYLRTAIALCRMTGVGPSFLLHPLDFLGGDQVPELSFFPGMDLGRDHKLGVFRKVMAMLTRHFRVSPMGVHAQALIDKGHLKRVRL